MNDVFGNLTSNPQASADFLSYWFNGQGISEHSLVSLVRIHPTLPRIASYTFSLDQIVGALTNDGLDPLIYDNGTIYDMYFSVHTLKSVPDGNKRGGMKNVHLIPGVWIDLDVKSGSFPSKEWVEAFLAIQEYPPSAVVWTGSGGAHGYWKFDVPQGPEVVKELALWWWAYQQKLVNDWSKELKVSIDKLCDPTRLLRLPGSIRWPKKAEESPAPVVVDYYNNTFTVEELRNAAAPAWSTHQERIDKKRKQVENSKMAAIAELKSSSNYWTDLIQISEIEEWFNEKYEWSSLLEPMGWTLLGEDDEARVMWSRPGDGYRKSATTDWPESPHVMSLFSSSEETGLYELYESQVVLTKYRVYVELFCGGDEALAIRTLREDFFS